MNGRKAEERNEKIIRGLMKLPPNRRCINCNALGPQYVCTDFWTFVCMICSGIHREFTHRVKSVSMSKFTAQEVEALERGGNQRAREIFLHDWDPQRHRFPVSSNADKVREFIKNVYVDRKYASKKTCEKPPRNLQQDKTHEDLTRRASSYHSYSQSPPYDYQYEERRYGKQAFALTRKAGSDRGLKTSSSFSPGRLGDYDIEEKFKKGHSSSRSSDYSISSAGDPCRSYNQSPTTERGIKVSSPPSETCGDMLSLDEWNQKVNKFSDNDKVYEDRSPHLQRTASNSNSMPFSSVNSGKASGAEQAAGTHCKLTTSISLPSSSVSSNYIGLDLFDTAFASQTITSSTSASGLFKSPEISSASPIDMFQPSSISLIPNVSSSAIGSQLLYSDQKKSVANFNTTSSNIVNHQYGLDLFDTDQYTHTSTAFAAQTSTSFASQTSTSSSSASDLFKSPEISSASPIDLFQPSSLSSIPNVISSVIASQPLYSDQKRSVATFNTTSSDIVNQRYGGWATFDGLQNMEPSQGGQSSTSAARPSSEGSSASDVDQYLYRNTTQQWSAFHDSSAQVTYPSMPIQWQSSPHNNVGIPSKSYQAEALSSTTNRSTNPFDIAYEYDVAPNNVFLDMSSMQGALPNSEMPTSISDDVTESWFPQGGIGLYGGPLPSAQLASIQSEGPVAPVGGNPFA